MGTSINKLPGKLVSDKTQDIYLIKYDLDAVMSRSKVELEQYVISFLQQGFKEINFAGSGVQINNTKALIISQGHCLVTEKGYGSQDYESILLFFSKQKLADLLLKSGILGAPVIKDTLPAYFIIEQDEFIKIFIQSLALHFSMTKKLSRKLLEAKFEELMTYLLDKYGERIINFLSQSLLHESNLSFKSAVEANKHTNLSMEEMAFLCNMSISTFKRRFTEVFNDTPGKWFKQRRLERARQLLQAGNTTPSEIFNGTGYKNLSHFSTAFKEKFGKSPKHIFTD